MVDQSRSIADLIRAKLAERGIIPEREILAVKYVAVARITLANGDGVEVAIKYLDNLRGDDEARVELTRMAVAEAEEKKAGRS